MKNSGPLFLPNGSVRSILAILIVSIVSIASLKGIVLSDKIYEAFFLVIVLYFSNQLSSSKDDKINQLEEELKALKVKE